MVQGLSYFEFTTAGWLYPLNRALSGAAFLVELQAPERLYKVPSTRAALWLALAGISCSYRGLFRVSPYLPRSWLTLLSSSPEFSCLLVISSVLRAREVEPARFHLSWGLHVTRFLSILEQESLASMLRAALPQMRS